MNPAFIIILIIAVVVLWFLLSFLFRPMGKFTYRIYKDAVDEMNKTENDKKQEGNQKNE